MTKTLLMLAASTALTAAPALAQMTHSGMQMPGMTMPMPTAKNKPTVKKVVVKTKVVARKVPAKVKAKTAVARKTKPAIDHSKFDHGAMRTPGVPGVPDAAAPVDHSMQDHGAMTMPTGPDASAPMDHGSMPMPASPDAAGPMNHSQMEHGPASANGPAVDHSSMPGMNHGAAGSHANMLGAFGPYSAAREASGTSWQPDSSEHQGWMISSGDWMFMVHGNADLVADTQSGRRGDDKVYVAGMLMGMATRTASNGNTLQFRAMVSPDPLMGKSGYPLLLASGETANGTDRLIDRQHPHDLFMELSASYSVKLAEKASAFVYGGLPGEPAFGPPAFMHRQSISTSPEAPISHHWLDSTHITFGVVTAGLVLDRVKIEASRFNGREPDERRYNIETGPLDSTSVRLSWNPTRELSLQGSWAFLRDPEQLEPGVNQRRLSASASYTRPMANGWWASTLAWGRKTIDGEAQDAFALESSYKWNDWTLFGRGEMTENNELVESEDGHGKAYKVAKASLGLVRDFPIAEHLAFGVGGLYSLNFIPRGLRYEYGSRNPHGAMGFMRLKIR